MRSAGRGEQNRDQTSYGLDQARGAQQASAMERNCQQLKETWGGEDPRGKGLKENVNGKPRELVFTYFKRNKNTFKG